MLFAHQIISLKDNDLKLRDELIRKDKLSDGYNQTMENLHEKNAKVLESIIDKIGYPTVEKLGKEASEAAWMVIQHAIGQPAFMKRCRDLLEIAVRDNKADPIDLAYLADRIAVFEGKSQLHGTQFDWDDNGVLSPNNFDDLAKLNERRRSLGLNSLEDQTEAMRSRVKNEKQSPPQDPAKRKLDFEEWKIKVGWTK